MAAPTTERSETVMEWRLSQVFGGDKPPDEDVLEADIVSAVEFDETGNFLAAGDKGGRIVVFERSDTKTTGTTAAGGASRRRESGHAPKAEYRFYAEFQSHEAEFDYLKSLEIEEKINKIRFLRRQNSALFLLTTNDKTIKLWKVFQKKIKQIAVMPASSPAGIAAATQSSVYPTQANSSSLGLTIPRLQTREISTTAQARRVFANAHAYHINSISPSSDQETYISADDLRINLWSLADSSQSFNIVDIKPENMDELSEVITCAEFHPIECSQFIYSSSKGAIKLADLRAAALCDRQVKTFEEEEDPSTRSFFSEIISSISDIKFSRCGRYILSRDYLTMKLWDIAMERKPIKTVRIHDHLRARLCDLYENDCIFDKFECAVNHNTTQIATGSYSRQFRVYDVQSRAELTLVASRIQPKVRKSSKSKVRGSKTRVNPPPPSSPEEGTENVDFTRKALHVSFHPHQNVLAIAAYNNLFIFS